MRKYKLFSLLAMFIIGIITLASCSSKITATGELIVLDQTRYTLTIKASLNDEAKEVTQGSVQIQLYNADGDRKTTSNCDKLGGTSEDTTQQVTIQSLDENTPYTVKLVCTIKEHQYTIAQIETKTNKAGSSHTEAIHITSADDFSKMANDLDGYYILDNDIALGTGNAENEGITEIEKGDLKEWTPVFSSSSSKAFTGTFDGNGHTISNFKQTSSTSDYGFFGYLAEGAQIKNINFENVYLNMTRYSDTYIGVVAGRAESGSSIENVKVSNLKIKVSTSSTSGKTFYVGGLIGQNTGGSIINSTVENLDLNIERGKVVYAGGIAGQNAMAEGKWIENCVVTGKITINKRDIDDYFGLETLKVVVRQPLVATETADKFDVLVNVHGGGFTGQAGAIRHGISRALLEADAEYRPVLKSAGYLTRDPRMKERKKPGLKAARRAPQFSKR